jgi:hypothetical protein
VLLRRRRRRRAARVRVIDTPCARVAAPAGLLLLLGGCCFNTRERVCRLPVAAPAQTRQLHRSPRCRCCCCSLACARVCCVCAPAQARLAVLWGVNGRCDRWVRARVPQDERVVWRGLRSGHYCRRAAVRWGSVVVDGWLRCGNGFTCTYIIYSVRNVPSHNHTHGGDLLVACATLVYVHPASLTLSTGATTSQVRPPPPPPHTHTPPTHSTQHTAHTQLRTNRRTCPDSATWSRAGRSRCAACNTRAPSPALCSCR